jgi:hypothetical protein
VKPVQFSREQRSLVHRAADEAEHHTSSYYCFPPHRWQMLQYDLLTRQDHEWEPLPESILARVQQIEAVRRRRHRFYRIQLNDAGILQAVERENLSAEMYPFLVYIITHELVHLVRLSSIVDDPRRLEAAPEYEEARVQQIARQVLSGHGRRTFDNVLERFCVPQVAVG